MKSLVAIGAIIAALVQFFTYLMTKHKYKGMPSITGKVLECKLDNYSDVDGKRIFKANIEIEYEFEAKSYKCRNPILRSFELFPAHEFESELVDSYKVGDQIEVKVNPVKPINGYIAVAPLSIISSVAIIFAAIAGFSYLYYANFVLSS